MLMRWKLEWIVCPRVFNRLKIRYMVMNQNVTRLWEDSSADPLQKSEKFLSKIF
jgi:hypothetical protein